MSIYGTGAQIRRGLARGLDFYTQNQLANRSAEQNALLKAATDRQRNTDALAERRIKTAMELARLGNTAVQGGLQDFVAGDENALANIGEFDQNRFAAEKFLEPILRQGQYQSANELASRVGLPQSFAPTAREKASVDLLGAQKMAAETKSKIDESVGAARVAHINALAGAARKRTDQIAKEIQQSAKGGKLGIENIKEMRALLEVSNDILGKQLEQISEAPDFWTDDARTEINPKYQQALKELSATNSYNRKLLDTLIEFQTENTLPYQSMLSAPPSTRRDDPGVQPYGPNREFDMPDGSRWRINEQGNYERVR